MATIDTSARSKQVSGGIKRPLPEYVDWIVGVIIAVGGLALTVGGAALTFVVDRGVLAAGIESGQITVVALQRDLTEAEMLDMTVAIVGWVGMGLLVTGIGLVLFAIAYVVVRHRARQRADDDERIDSSRSYAVLGAVATAVLSFLPFSPVVGGGLAGYLEHPVSGRATSVGGLAGLLSMVPAMSILVFLTAGLYTGFASVGESGMGLVVIAGMLLVLLVVAAYGAGLGALGGFAGGRLADHE